MTTRFTRSGQAGMQQHERNMSGRGGGRIGGGTGSRIEEKTKGRIEQLNQPRERNEMKMTKLTREKNAGVTVKQEAIDKKKEQHEKKQKENRTLKKCTQYQIQEPKYKKGKMKGARRCS